MSSLLVVKKGSSCVVQRLTSYACWFVEAGGIDQIIIYLCMMDCCQSPTNLYVLVTNVNDQKCHTAAAATYCSKEFWGGCSA
jgi:hypothetical protein